MSGKLYRSSSRSSYPWSKGEQKASQAQREMGFTTKLESLFDFAHQEVFMMMTNEEAKTCLFSAKAWLPRRNLFRGQKANQCGVMSFRAQESARGLTSTSESWVVLSSAEVELDSSSASSNPEGSDDDDDDPDQEKGVVGWWYSHASIRIKLQEHRATSKC